jgi:hypothetical protein
VRHGRKEKPRSRKISQDGAAIAAIQLPVLSKDNVSLARLPRAVNAGAYNLSDFEVGRDQEKGGAEIRPLCGKPLLTGARVILR